MPSYSSRKILRILKDDGWVEKNQRGSYLHLIHPMKKGKVTVPHPVKDLDQKLVRSILRQAGLDQASKREEGAL